MRRRPDPNKMIVGMMPRACKECGHIQHVFFPTQKAFDEWDCPVCLGRIEPDEVDTQPEIIPE